MLNSKNLKNIICAIIMICFIIVGSVDSIVYAKGGGGGGHSSSSHSSSSHSSSSSKSTSSTSKASSSGFKSGSYSNSSSSSKTSTSGSKSSTTSTSNSSSKSNTTPKSYTTPKTNSNKSSTNTSNTTNTKWTATTTSDGVTKAKISNFKSGDFKNSEAYSKPTSAKATYTNEQDKSPKNINYEVKYENNTRRVFVPIVINNGNGISGYRSTIYDEDDNIIGEETLEGNNVDEIFNDYGVNKNAKLEPSSEIQMEKDLVMLGKMLLWFIGIAVGVLLIAFIIAYISDNKYEIKLWFVNCKIKVLKFIKKILDKISKR